jgi:DNA modification methylase
VVANTVYLTVADCREFLASLPNNSIDSCVTDSPYEISHMNRGWDATGIAYNVDMWTDVLRVLKPGSYLLAFGGTRTYHRQTCAIEDAGFEIRDCLMWLYLTGFPHSRDIGKFDDPNWKGFGTNLKTAVEPIVLCRKPPIGTIGENLKEYGVGALNIDACRGPEGRWPANALFDDAIEGDVPRYFYVPKASTKERELGCEDLPEVRRTDGRTSERHVPNLRTTHRRNHHPCVKPIELMRYLCRLVTPLGGTVLDPFLGSGTTAIAAVLEGFRFLGCDLTPEYIEIARARLEYWIAQGSAPATSIDAQSVPKSSELLRNPQIPNLFT